MNPFERGDLVAQAKVRGELVRVAREVEIAERTEAVVEVDEDDIALAHERFAEMGNLAGRPGRVRATVDEDHDRLALARLRRDDVDAEAVLIHRHPGHRCDLRGDRPESRGVPRHSP